MRNVCIVFSLSHQHQIQIEKRQKTQTTTTTTKKRNSCMDIPLLVAIVRQQCCRRHRRQCLFQWIPLNARTQPNSIIMCSDILLNCQARATKYFNFRFVCLRLLFFIYFCFFLRWFPLSSVCSSQACIACIWLAFGRLDSMDVLWEKHFIFSENRNLWMNLFLFLPFIKRMITFKMADENTNKMKLKTE